MRPTSIDNGRRVVVSALPLYAGEAGVRETADGGEFAAPFTIALGTQAFTGTVDGRPVRIIGARPSPADKQMLVISFAWEPAK